MVSNVNFELGKTVDCIIIGDKVLDWDKDFDVWKIPVDSIVENTGTKGDELKLCFDISIEVDMFLSLVCLLYGVLKRSDVEG